MTVNNSVVQTRLEQRKDALIKRSHDVQRDLTRATGPLSADSSEQAIEVENDQALEAIGRAAAVEIEEIDEALGWLAEGQYGTCKSCGKAIDPRRLAAVPQSVYCANCR